MTQASIKKAVTKDTKTNKTDNKLSEDKANPKSSYLSSLVNFFIFIPAAIYFSLINTYAVNFPFQDDYNAILEFLTKFKVATFTDKISLLFSQHGEHRIFHSRIIYVLYYSICGNVNFRNLIFIGNLQLVVIFLVLVHFIKKAIPKYWQIASLAAGLCIFDPSSYENADWAMCGVQNYGVIMLFFLSLYFYSRPGYKNLISGALFQFICIFSSGNGIICALCLVAYLVLSKEKIRSIIGGIIFVVCSGLYYFHYTKAEVLGEVKSEFSIMRVVRFFLHMIGSHFSYESGIAVGVIILVLLLATLPISLKLKIKENTLPFLCILALILGTTFTISLFRSSLGMGELAAYSGRYMIYSHLTMAMLFVFIWIKLDGKKLFWYATSIGAIALLFAYKNNYAYGESCMNMTKERLKYYPYYYRGRTPADTKEAKDIEQAACKVGIYCIQDER